MAQPASPVSSFALRKLELKTAACNKVFLPNQNAKQITFSLQRQNFNSTLPDFLMLVIHNDTKPLISIRLTDILRNSGTTSNIISASSSSHIICVKISNPDCTLLSHFENARDFHISVYVLERAGFTIGNTLQAPSLHVQGPIPRHNSENIAPMRLSSIMSFPFSSQPELFTRAELPKATSVAPIDPFRAFQMREAESFPTQHMEDFFSSNSAPNQPIELNPYHHFASERSGVASPHIYRPLQQTSYDGQDITKPSSVAPLRQIQTDTPLQRPVSVLALQTTAHPANNSSLGDSLPVEQLDDDTLSKAADYRVFLPQARSLPFIPTKAKIESASAGTKSTAKRKSVQVGENAKTSPPSKRKQPAKKEVLENKKTVKPPPKPRRQPKGQLPSDQTEARQSSVASQKPIPKISTAKQRPSDSNSGSKLLSKNGTPKQVATVQKAGEEETSPVDETPATKALPKKKTPKSTSVQKSTPAKQGRGRARKIIPANGLQPSKAVSGNSTANMIDDLPPNEATPQSCPKILAVSSDCEDQGINSHNYSKQLNDATDVFRTDASLINCESNSTLMIAESAMLNALNRMTWKIIDQYETDIDKGLSRFEIAQYYVDNLHNTRFNFWHDKLAELGS